MRDFTLNTFRLLASALKKRGYQFFTVRDLIQYYNQIQTSDTAICVLRHDVDRLPLNSLATAKTENSLGIKGTYYFRIVEESFNETIIRQIEALGHEIGYHYEDVDLAQKQLIKTKQTIENDGLVSTAYILFKSNLEKLRAIAHIDTICMHGSPLSKYDNKLMWQKFSYKELGIICEPYLDINWDQFGYLTDTGRRWDGDKYNVRDKVSNISDRSNEMDLEYALNQFNKNKYRSTIDIIEDINSLPRRIMFTLHPQRWNNNIYPWTKELLSQTLKNYVKKYFYVKR